VQAFVDDIRGAGDVSFPTLYDGWKVQEVIDAVHASAASASWEKC
jgi:predicted dehydrogenase